MSSSQDRRHIGVLLVSWPLESKMAQAFREGLRDAGYVERRDLLELVGATELTDEQTRLLKDGMQLLVGYLGAVRAGWDDEDAPMH